MHLMIQAMTVLAQIPKEKVNPAIPVLPGDASPVMPWIIGGLLAAGILLIAFKTAKRNHLDKAD